MRIRKKEQTAGLIGKVINSRTESTTDTYSADYINTMQSNVEQSIATNIKTVDYIAEYPQLPSNSPKYRHIVTSEPDGYSLLCYVIKSNEYKSQVFQSIIDSTPTTCGINLYNFGSEPFDVKITVMGIYIKTTE